MPTAVGQDENGGEMYLVSHLVAARTVKRQRQYLVHWLGWPEEERTWEDAASIHDARLIDDLRRRGARLRSSPARRSPEPLKPRSKQSPPRREPASRPRERKPPRAQVPCQKRRKRHADGGAPAATAAIPPSSLPEPPYSEVLLSPDLAPHILAQLPTKEHAVKGTCRAWRRGWKETLATRERPRMLVYGGANAGGIPLNSVERYDPSTNEWGEEAVAPMPTARLLPAIALLDGKFYATGGMNAGDAPSRSVERYDLATKVWEVRAPMATPRELHGLAELGGKLYAVGGLDDGGNSHSSVEHYDPALDAWEEVAPMAARRTTPGVAVLDGKLYAVGGCGAGHLFLSSGGARAVRPDRERVACGGACGDGAVQSRPRWSMASSMSQAHWVPATTTSAQWCDTTLR